MGISQAREAATFGQLERQVKRAAQSEPANTFFGALSSYAQTIKELPTGLTNYRLVEDHRGSLALKGEPTDRVLGYACDKSFLQSTDGMPTAMTDCFARRAAMIAVAGYSVGMTSSEIFNLGETRLGEKAGYMEKRMELSDDQVLSKYMNNIGRYCAKQNVGFDTGKEVSRYLETHRPYLEKMPDAGNIKEDEQKAWQKVQQGQSQGLKYTAEDAKTSKESAKKLVTTLATLNTHDDTPKEGMKGFKGIFNATLEDIKNTTTHSKSFMEKSGVRFDMPFEQRNPKEKTLIEKEVALLQKMRDKAIEIDTKNKTSGIYSDNKTATQKEKAIKGLAKEYFKVREERAKLFDKPTDNILSRPGMKLSGFKPSAPTGGDLADSMDSSLDSSIEAKVDAPAVPPSSPRLPPESEPSKEELATPPPTPPEPQAASKDSTPPASPRLPPEPEPSKEELATPPPPPPDPTAKSAESGLEQAPSTRSDAFSKFRGVSEAGIQKSSLSTGASSGVQTLIRKHQERINDVKPDAPELPKSPTFRK